MKNKTFFFFMAAALTALLQASTFAQVMREPVINLPEVMESLRRPVPWEFLGAEQPQSSGQVRQLAAKTEARDFKLLVILFQPLNPTNYVRNGVVQNRLTKEQWQSLMGSRADYVASLANHWSESTGGTWNVGVDVTDWLTINANWPSSDNDPAAANTPTNMFNSWQPMAAQAAAAKGFNLANYDKILYVNSWCGGAYSGHAYMNDVKATVMDFVEGAQLSQALHELGHTLGMHHAGNLACSGATPLTGTCTVNTYGDSQDPMTGGSRHYSAHNRTHLMGSNAAAGVTQIFQSGVYVLQAKSEYGEPTALTYVLPSGHPFGFSMYWEFRRNYGSMETYSDAETYGNKGLTMRFWRSVASSGQTVNNPDTMVFGKNPSDPNSAFLPGDEYADPYSGVRTKVIAQIGDSLVVAIGLSGQLPDYSGLPLVSRASLVNAGYANKSVPNDGLVSLFGVGLASGTFSATDKTTTNLGGAQVLINGSPAILLYASPGQINFHLSVPAGTTSVKLVVDLSGKRSPEVTLPIRDFGYSAFTQNQQGYGDAAAVFRASDPKDSRNGKPVTPVNPLVGGSCVEVYGTGLPASKAGLTVKIGSDEGQPDYWGRHAVFLGLDQINVCFPLLLSYDGPFPFSVCKDAKCTSPVRLWFKANTLPLAVAPPVVK